LGLKTILEVEDWCSLKQGGIDKYWHPYYVSPQAHSTATPGGLYGDALKQYMKKYWARLFQVTDKYGGVWISVMNEYDFKQNNPDGTPMDPTEEKVKMVQWYRDSRYFFLGYQSVASAMRYHKELAALTNYYSFHGTGNQETYQKEIKLFKDRGFDITVNTERLIPSGDGFSTGTGIVDFKGRRGITTQEVPWLANMVMNRGYAGYEVLVRYKHGHANGTYEEFQDRYGGYDIVREFGNRFGTIPPPPTPPEPPAPPEPPPTPPEPEHKSIWQRIWEWIKSIFS
jgi:hypothetical protein